MTTILLADDDPLILVTLQEVFSKAGMRVLSAANGEEAIRLALSERPELAVMDLIMPTIDGISAIETLRKETPALKIIAVSGGGRNRHHEILELARQKGADAVLQKPFSIKQLVQLALQLGPRSSSEPVQHPCERPAQPEASMEIEFVDSVRSS